MNARVDNFDIPRRKSVFGFIVRLCKDINAVITSILQSVCFIHGSHLLAKWKDTQDRNDHPRYYVYIYPLTLFLPSDIY